MFDVQKPAPVHPAAGFSLPFTSTFNVGRSMFDVRCSMFKEPPAAGFLIHREAWKPLSRPANKGL
jgi:hypothetical protein